MSTENYNFKRIGENVEIYDPISIISSHNIHIGEYVRLSELSLISGGEHLSIGNFIHIANHVSIIGGGTCILEDFVGVCAGTRIITGTDDILGDGIPSPMVPEKYRSFYRSKVHIKKHAFIGTNVVIQPGVTIGEGAVIGSGSVVTKDIEPWTINMGIPAKAVKERNKETILEMEQQVYREMNVRPFKIEVNE